MFLKKLLLKITDKKKYRNYKIESSLKEKLGVYKNKLEKKIINIQNNIKNKTEISLLHSGNLGDTLNSLPVVRELSKNHKCNFYIQAGKKIEVEYNDHPGGKIFLNKTMINKLMPLLKKQKFINHVDLFQNQEIDIDLDIFREMPINFNLDSVRWYFQVTGVHTDLTMPHLYAEDHKTIKNKVVILRSLRRQSHFINYKFMSKYNNLLFVGLEEEYKNLKKEVPNLEFYNCKDFLEMAEIIKSSKFFLGNLSFGYAMAEGLKVPRLLESCPDFPTMYPNGKNAFDFYFQEHFEKLFDNLYRL